MGKEQDPVPVKRGTPGQQELQAGGVDAQDSVPEKPGGGPRKAPKNRWGGMLKPLLERKWMLVAASAVVLVIAGMALYRGSESAKGQHPRQAPGPRDQALQDGLRQEELPRFFIPLPQTSQNRVAVVDFAVVWDALSAVRFKKMECQVRDRLYAFMLGLAGKGEDLQNNASTLEAEMDRIFREALRTENIAVKVREIRSY